MTYILVMYIYAGMLAKGDSVTLVNAGEYTSIDACNAAGMSGNELVKGSAKEYRYLCLKKGTRE
jgi:hypothetical protein